MYSHNILEMKSFTHRFCSVDGMELLIQLSYECLPCVNEGLHLVLHLRLPAQLGITCDRHGHQNHLIYSRGEARP